MPSAPADPLDRINRTLSYVDDHLGDPLDLATLARIAGFSRFHFHRVFTQVAGVPPQEYVKRRRLEMSFHLLSNDTTATVGRVAALLGFSSPSNLARSFRERYGFAPGRLRDPSFRPPGRPADEPSRLLTLVDPARVRLEAVEPFQILYTRARGSPGPRAAVAPVFMALRMECARRGWTREGARQVIIRRSFPGLVAPERSLFDFGVELPAGVRGADAAHVQTVAGGGYACCEYRGDPSALAGCWVELYAIWLRRSGFSAGDGFGYTVLPSERTRGAFLLYQPVRLAA
jgi:AraC family transcriptional regulator